MSDHLNLIVKMKFGSHLYGTATELSDTDYKGLFMPTREEIYLGRIPKAYSHHSKKSDTAKNTPKDVDSEMYSLHYFIHLACQGETVALDMLHAPREMLVYSSPLWEQIVAERKRFYTKNLKAFIGYARRQAAKYGIKGSRLNDAKRVLDFVVQTTSRISRSMTLEESLCQDLRLQAFWDELPSGEHIIKHGPDSNGIRMYEVCGRKIGETATLNYLHDVVARFHAAYGERARQAANNENVDWKAVSHAFRAAFQIKHILTRGDLTFPLPEAGYLLEVKKGKLHFQKTVAPLLDELIAEVELLSQRSKLPEKVNRKWWDAWLVEAVDAMLRERTSFSTAQSNDALPWQS